MRWTEGASRSIYQTVPAMGETRKHRERLATSECTRDRARRIPLRLQRGPLGHDAVLHIPPECDRQFPGQRYDADALTPAPGRAKAGQKPLRQALVGCQRTQHHASCRLIRRNSARPALLIP